MKPPLAVLAESEIPLLIIGGTAVQLYGYSRFTKDLDCLVVREDRTRIREILIGTGFAEFDQSNVVVRYQHQIRTDWVLDTLFASADTFNKMWARRTVHPFGTLTLNVAAPLHVIAMKLHAMKHNRAREMFDLLDVAELIKLQRNTFQRDELETVCDRYSTHELRERLLTLYDS